MRHQLFCLLVVATLGSISASGSAAPAFSQPGAQAQYGPESRSPRGTASPDPKDAKTRWRWIGLRKKGLTDCPPVAGWKAEPLLDHRKAAADRGDLLRRFDFDRFCVYTTTANPPLFPESPLPSGLVKAAPDRMALSTTAAGGPSSGAPGPEFWPILAEHFRAQAGRAPLPLLRKEPPSVRLVFLDTQPTGEGVPAHPGPAGPWHGYTLWHLARQLVCGDVVSGPEPAESEQPCAVEFATRLALPHPDFDPTKPLPTSGTRGGQGGHLGLMSDLAMAIEEEVSSSRELHPDKKLILNLSLGWDGELFGDLDARKISQLDPAVQAVYRALRYARRNGALVIASAGNRRGGSESDWPLLPAAWELRRPWWLRFAVCRKPVYAVGGVESQGLPLTNSRRGGQPRRVTYADHAVTELADPSRPTAMYTGTSVSAAVASSIAAVVWHLRPELKPVQVIRLIERSGKDLPSRADFYARKPLALLVKPPYLRRLSLCRAMALACSPGTATGSSTCSTLGAMSCPEWDGKPANLPPGPLGVPISYIEAPPPVDCPDASDPRSHHLIVQGGGEPPVLCPLDLFPDVENRRWVVPQPPDVPCPNCTLFPKEPTSAVHSDYVLDLQISSEWLMADITIESAVLAIDCSDGKPTERMTYAIPKGNLTGRLPSSPVSLPNIRHGRSLEGCTAAIDFKLIKGGNDLSLRNPVLVDP